MRRAVLRLCDDGAPRPIDAAGHRGPVRAAVAIAAFIDSEYLCRAGTRLQLCDSRLRLAKCRALQMGRHTGSSPILIASQGSQFCSEWWQFGAPFRTKLLKFQSEFPDDYWHCLLLLFASAHRSLQPHPQSGQTAEFLHGAGASVWKQRRCHTAQRASGTEFKSCYRAGRSAALEASGPLDGG
jgi:hypothetical protein